MSLRAAGSLKAFLGSARKVLQNAIVKQDRVSLVIGNESADLDSITSSILFAYFRSQSLSGSSSGSGYESVYVPLLNIPRSDVRIRAELLKLLPYGNLEPDDLITLDEIQNSDQQLKPENTRWCLTDHNSLQGSLGDTYSARVFGCIDHHIEENKVPKEGTDEPRIVKPTGSCTSLVVGYFRDTWEKLSNSSSESNAAHVQNGAPPGASGVSDRKTWDAQIAKLALGSILVDTSDLKAKEKVTEDDKEAVAYLEQKIQQGPDSGRNFDRHKFFKEIDKAKRNLEGLSVDDMLRKDYKEWTENGIKIGVSSVVASLSHMLSEADSSANVTRTFLDTLKSFANAHHLGILAVMTKSSSASGKRQKELLVWELDTRTQNFAQEFTKSSQEDLHLESWNEHAFVEAEESVHVWWQRNVEKTRKQVAPMLRETAKTLHQK